MAFDVLAVMDHLQLEKAAFLGWSDGACTALVLARNAALRSAGVFFFACNMDPSGQKDVEPSPRPVFQAAHQGLCPVVGHAGSIRVLFRCSPPDAEDRTQ
jgi:pimeloyl-ACP methyl ester carboxylesterase